MSSKNLPWTPGAILAPHLLLIAPEVLQSGWVIVQYVLISVLAIIWLGLVNTNVPEPYLDEIFHIPQAQVYCAGKYDYWDPKLTTPPGLYVFATLFNKIIMAGCTVSTLRLFNAVVLPVTMIFGLACRYLITSSYATKSNASRRPSADAIHAAFNIALFPPLFFFSGLFYTDLLSTCVVLATYRLFLNSRSAGLWRIYPIGLVALAMRQTNIFWVAVFLGGLEVVRSVKIKDDLKQQGDVSQQTLSGSWKEIALSLIERWSRGDIHDIKLNDAGVHDFVLCALSIVIAVLHQPLRGLGRLGPYILLLVSFGVFVYWNGGVVLGDKSNHVATIHLTQILYLFAFVAFFSLPLLLSPILGFLRSLRSLLSLPLFPRLRLKYIVVSTYCLAALAVTLAVIKYNTIIHPFTLADNRHYVFYVFRYSILRHPLIRYLLAPVYVALGWSIYLTLCSPDTSSLQYLRSNNVVLANTQNASSSLSKNGQDKSSLEEAYESYEGPTISFLLVFLVTTALSLITAPLVEPRYFILPWLIWRLHVPSSTPISLAPSTKHEKRGEEERVASTTRSASIKSWNCKNQDYRLWLETIWFLTINLVTGYIFLYRGFSWPQEPGKVQRFMW